MFTSETTSNGVTERAFELTVNDERVPGVLWAPVDASGRRPLLLIGHGGGQHKKAPPLAAGAQRYAASFGFAVVALDAPGHGERPPSERTKRFIAEMKQRMSERQPVAELVAREMAAAAVQSVPEWQRTLDAVQSLDFVGASGPVGYLGMAMGAALGVPLIAAEPRITAAILGLVGLLPGHDTFARAAAGVRVPLQFVAQWADELVSRESSLALFEAFGSSEKTLHMNSGGHMAVPPFERESWERFFLRHLTASPAPAP